MARITVTQFMAQLFGVQLDAAQTVAVAGALGALGFYSPGIPSGGLFVMTPIYIAFGLPVDGIGLLIAVDIIRRHVHHGRERDREHDRSDAARAACVTSAPSRFAVRRRAVRGVCGVEDAGSTAADILAS